MVFRVFLSLVGLATNALAADPLVMFNRDRSASFPDARPVYAFDGQSGSNILWKTRLPNWSNSSPIVAGQRVFTMVEPWQGYSPWLFCFDAVTGKELWRRELDAVAQFPKAEQDATRTLTQETWDWWRRAEALWAETLRLYEANKEHFAGWDKPPAAISQRWAAIQQEVEAAGFQFTEIRSGAGGVNAPFRLKPASEARVKRLRELGLMWNHWRGFGTWLGEGYPTPCSDGRYVYTLTVHNLYSCHDRDGNLVWQVRFSPTSRKLLTRTQQERVAADARWPEHWPGQGGFSTSPVLVDLDGDGKNRRLISCAGQMFRCLDAKDGRELWALPYLPQIGQAMGVPAVARIEGEPVVIGCGHEGWAGRTGDEIIRVRDGASVGLLPGTGTGKDSGNGPLVTDDNLVVTWKKHDREGWTLAGYRLTWRTDRTALDVQEVWELPGLKGFNPLWRGAWCEGIGYAARGTGAIDLRTGKMLPVNFRAVANGGYCGAGAFVTGPALLTWNLYGGAKKTSRDGQADFVFCDRQTGALLGTGHLPINPPDGATAPQKRAAEHRSDAWRWLGGASPWADGDRLYIRSYDFLWCIGRK